MKNKRLLFSIYALIIIIALSVVGSIYYFKKVVEEISIKHASRGYNLPQEEATSSEATGIIKSAYTKEGKNYIDIDEKSKIRTLEISPDVSIQVNNTYKSNTLMSEIGNLNFDIFKEIFLSETDVRKTNPWNIVIQNNIVIKITEDFRS